MSIVPVTGLTDISGGGLLIGLLFDVGCAIYIDVTNRQQSRLSVPRRTSRYIGLVRRGLRPCLQLQLLICLFVQSQCEHLSKQCLNLASALRDYSDKLEGTGAQQAVDEVER